MNDQNLPDSEYLNTDRFPASDPVSPELRFLLAESCSSPTVQQDQAVFSMLKKPFRRELLAGLACRNGLCPLLAKNLKRLHLTDSRFRPVLDTAETGRYLCALLTAELAGIFRLFQENGIRALALKGPLLARQLYGAVSLRSYTDLDIYVDPARYAEARDLLIQKGYRPSDHIETPKQLRYTMRNPIFHHTDLAKDPVCVELHWKSLDLEPLSFESLYQRHRTDQLCETEIACLAPADCFCLLLRHGVHHGFSQLKWIIDLCELLQKADSTLLDEVCRLLSESRSLHSLYTFLLLADRLCLFPLKKEDCTGTEILKADDGSVLLKAPLNGDAFAAAKQLCDAAFRNITEPDSGRKQNGKRTYDLLYRKLRYRLGLADRKTEFFKLISPGSQDFALIRLPDPLFFLYYPLRPGYWIYHRLRSLRSSRE